MDIEKSDKIKNEEYYKMGEKSVRTSDAAKLREWGAYMNRKQRRELAAKIKKQGDKNAKRTSK